MIKKLARYILRHELAAIEQGWQNKLTKAIDTAAVNAFKAGQKVAYANKATNFDEVRRTMIEQVAEILETEGF